MLAALVSHAGVVQVALRGEWRLGPAAVSELQAPPLVA
jgi:hypothetical protein